MAIMKVDFIILQFIILCRFKCYHFIVACVHCFTIKKITKINFSFAVISAPTLGVNCLPSRQLTPF